MSLPVLLAKDPQELAELSHKFRQSMVDPLVERQCLESALYNITTNHPFLGTLLQCLSIEYTHHMPTCGVGWDVNAKKWSLAINPPLFCLIWDGKQREAIMLHEILHLTHAHPMRFSFQASIAPGILMLYNMAMDMAINQMLSNLPTGCAHCPPTEELDNGAQCLNVHCPGKGIFVSEYYDIDKNGAKVPWEYNKPFETYFEKLARRLTSVEECPQCDGSGEVDAPPQSGQGDQQGEGDGEGDQDGDGQGEGQGEGQGNGQGQGQGNGQGNSSGKGGKPSKYSQAPQQGHGKAGEGQHAPNGKEPCPCCSGKGKVQKQAGRKSIDEHKWDDAGEEKDQLDATEELIQRAMIKRSMSYDNLPGHAKELLQHIKTRRKQLDYRGMLLSAIKKHATGIDRKRTWTRPSRRYGQIAPGSKVGDLPKVLVTIDTSGSISIEELNEFLDVVDGVLKAGARKCQIALWHTDVYKVLPYKLGDRFKKEMLQSGGTDCEPWIDLMVKMRPNLTLTLTDGCYGDVNWESKVSRKTEMPQSIIIISKNGQANHPLKDMANTVTIQIPST